MFILFIDNSIQATTRMLSREMQATTVLKDACVNGTVEMVDQCIGARHFDDPRDVARYHFSKTNNLKIKNKSSNSQ